MQSMSEVLLNFWPLVVLQIGLAIGALLDMRKRTELRYLPRLAWIVIVVLVNLVGPIVYFAVGRGEQIERD